MEFITNQVAVSEADLLSVYSLYRLQPGRQNDYGTSKHSSCIYGPRPIGLSERQLHVEELQKTDVKTCRLHDQSNNEKQLMEGKYSIVYGRPEVA